VRRRFIAGLPFCATSMRPTSFDDRKNLTLVSELTAPSFAIPTGAKANTCYDRLLGWAGPDKVAFFMMAHGKNYYSAPAYGVVFAGGAVAIERLFSSDWMMARPLLRRVTKTLLVFWPWLKRWR
jgi:hypothetical protein